MGLCKLLQSSINPGPTALEHGTGWVQPGPRLIVEKDGYFAKLTWSWDENCCGDFAVGKLFVAPHRFGAQPFFGSDVGTFPMWRAPILDQFTYDKFDSTYSEIEEIDLTTDVDWYVGPHAPINRIFNTWDDAFVMALKDCDSSDSWILTNGVYVNWGRLEISAIPLLSYSETDPPI